MASFSLDVVRALEILHDYKIMHRDLVLQVPSLFNCCLFEYSQKSQNLFINLDMAGNMSHLTLADFDSAKVMENNEAAKTMIGTVGWMPPEVFASSGKSYTFRWC